MTMELFALEKTLSSRNPAMNRLIESLARLAKANATILIMGESGTGKELIARKIHSLSDRRSHRFVAINCAAVPESLLESELFGHERGAFTGAHAVRRGLIQEADGGTLFLDEIGDMSQGLQAKLLRVLQEKVVTPLGSSQTKPVDFRLITATHRDLRKSVANGEFRGDLFYRLNVVPLSVPPLRERPEDIPILAVSFVEAAARRNRLPVPELSVQAIEKLQSKTWEGNVRELENFIERVVVNSTTRRISVDDIPDDESLESELFPGMFRSSQLPTAEHLVDQYILYVYKHVGFHQGRASAVLGLSRRTIYRKLRKYGASTVTH